MRGLKKTAPDGAHKQTDTQTDGHGESMTNSAQWGELVKMVLVLLSGTQCEI